VNTLSWSDLAQPRLHLLAASLASVSPVLGDESDAELIALAQRAVAAWRTLHAPPVPDDWEQADVVLGERIDGLMALYEQAAAIPAVSWRGLLAKLELYGTVTRERRDSRRALPFYAERPNGPADAMLASVLVDLERQTGAVVR